MSQRLLCAGRCGSRYSGKPDRYEAYPADDEGPAEWVRLKRGQAAQPTEAQRTLFVNGEPEKQSTAHYNCDG